ncbi:MAG: aspartate--tRNA ligase [Myxococcota bacterium]
MRFIDELKRTHSCGGLRETDIDAEVVLFGWVQSRRDHGGCIFVDLRDREGITQVVFDPAEAKEPFEVGDQARPEWVLGVRGRVRDRGKMRNPRLPTGAVEVVALEACIFNRSETPPFEIDENVDTHEDKRLEFRYLDLRRPPLQRALRTRHVLNHVTRNYLNDEGFLEVETPFMVKYTPGGARNFLVPSRLHPGHFYALAESPQLYKQLLMVSGYDRYFQIVRCFRDEALRVDRQPEFTQIDIEMSFINQDDLFGVMEGLVFRLWKEGLGVDLEPSYPDGTFPRMGYEESMRRFGNDKPDLRFGLEHTDLTDLVIEHGGGGVPLLEPIAQKFSSGEYRRDLPREIAKALVVPAEHAFSRSELDKLEQFVRSMGSKGLARAKVGEGGGWTQSPLAKSVRDDFRQAVNEAVGAQPGDLILFQFGPAQKVHTVMANLRLHLGKKLGMIPESGSGGQWSFLWVVNPPLFDWDEDSKRWVAAHHMFTRPHDAHVDLLESDPGKVQCYRYDLVLNGFEIAGGSIRLHDPEVQKRVFQVIGLGEQEARDKFGFLLDALEYGAPPHGGIAFGMDRVAMLAAETESIRDVIAFPKTQRGYDLMTGAPSRVDPDQLIDLKIRTLE